MLIVVKILRDSTFPEYQIKFDIILNNKFEKVQMKELLSFDQYQTLNLQLGYTYDSANIPLYYFTELQIYQGGFYYLDYDLKDPCFLYYNRLNMKCIIPKDGFVIKNDKAIPLNECNLGRNIKETILFYNPITKKCQDSKKLIPNCIQIDYKDINTCIKCIHDSMNPKNNCECKNGMFFDELLKQCSYCSPLCETCSKNKNFCLTCYGSDQQPPKCDCLYQNQYLDNKYQCQCKIQFYLIQSFYEFQIKLTKVCSPQCEYCFEFPDKCTACSEGRFYPPFCYCDKKIYENTDLESLQNECRPIKCQKNCETCEYSSVNCIQCKGNRINPPQCECNNDEYDDPTEINCQKCESSFYFDFKSQKCQKCYDLCEICNGPTDSNCKKCKGSLQLNDYNQCGCSSGIQADRNNPNTCYSSLSIIYYKHFDLNEYKIVIEFELEIDFLTEIIAEQGINNIITLTLSEVPQEFYQISDYEISKSSQLILKIQINQSFQSSFGFILFKETNIFRNEKQKKVLDSIYKKEPLQFQIGPYVFVLQQNDKTVLKIIQNLTPTNQQFMKILKNLQFIFYVINSSQPTAIFLLVKIQIPINFYSFLQLFGSFVYKYMPEYQQNDNQQNFDVLGNDVNQYVKSSGSAQFDRLGFRDAFLVNCEVIFYKYFVIIFLIIMISILKEIQFLKDMRKKENESQICKRILEFLIGRISKENEINLLMIILSISIQIQNGDFYSNWLSRWSFYATSFIAFTFFASIFWLFRKYNSRLYFKFQNIFDIYFGRLREERFSSSWFIKNYHFIYLTKKILLVFLIFILAEYPMFLCCFGAILNISTAILTLYLRPYKVLIQTLVKGIGDILLFLIWVFMIIFYKFSLDHVGQVILSENEVQVFLLQGLIATLLLLTFNINFFILFIFENIIQPIYYQKYKNKKLLVVYQKMKATNKKDNIISIEHEIQQNKNLIVYLEFENSERDQKRILLN